MSNLITTTRTGSRRSASPATTTAAVAVAVVADKHYRSRPDLGIVATTETPTVVMTGRFLRVGPRADRKSRWAPRAEFRIDGAKPLWPLALARAVGHGLMQAAKLAECREALNMQGLVESLPLAAWSIHPVSAAVLAKGMSHLQDVLNASVPRGGMRLRDDAFGGAVRDVVIDVDQGVVTLVRATIVDRGGNAVAHLRSRRDGLVVFLPGFGRDTLATALPGLTPYALIDLFGADPRSSLAPIVKADVVGRRSEMLRVRFDDVLVPVDPEHAGGEDWRPTRAVEPWPLGRIDRELSKALFEAAREAAARQCVPTPEQAISQMLSHTCGRHYTAHIYGRRLVGRIAAQSPT